jgi:hypothetical protein
LIVSFDGVHLGILRCSFEQIVFPG